ncbi:MAG: sorbosone dehydrogenase family protein [Phycisphaerae bacterium]
MNPLYIRFAAILFCSIFSVAAGAQQVPAGFRAELVAEGLQQPIAIAFDGPNRIFVAEKTGAIRLIEDGILRSAPFAQLEVHTFLECGVLGLALDPDFSNTHYVYVFATVSPEEQQIIRMTDMQGVGTEQTVIRGFLPTSGTLHNGGCLKVGPDGLLYFSIGDTENPDAAQSLTSLSGAISRINLDGSTPSSNPFETVTGAPRAQIAYGFRNPFRFDFMPDGRLFVLDIGSDLPARTEEINLVSIGDNCGWPILEGANAEAEFAEFVPPAFTYVELGSAPTGALHYGATQFPEKYHDDFFHADYVSNAIYHVEVDGAAITRHEKFAQLDGGPVDLALSPDGSIYVAEVISGRIERIVFADEDAGNENSSSTNANVGSVANANEDRANTNSGDGNHGGNGPVPSAPCAAPLAALLGWCGFVAQRRFRSRPWRASRADC